MKLSRIISVQIAKIIKNQNLDNSIKNYKLANGIPLNAFLKPHDWRVLINTFKHNEQNLLEFYQLKLNLHEVTSAQKEMILKVF